MPTLEEFDKKINDVISILNDITKFNIEEDLIRNNFLGSSLNFETCRDIFNKIFDVTNEIKDGNLNQLPYNKLNTLFDQAKSVLNKLNEIKSFDPATQSPNRVNLITSIRDTYENYYTNIFDILNSVKLQKFKPSEIEKEIKNKLKTIKEISTEADAKLLEINDILSKSKQAAGKTGVAEYASYFKDEAGDHEEKSKRWFRGIIFMSIVVIIWGIILMWWIKSNLSVGEAIQYSIAKFIVLSALFYILVWVTKNYNAHRHNYVVNKHRANSLNSFETFVKSTEDPATKDAVLLQATQSIFNPQSSGYDNKETENDPSNKFIEVLRHIEPKIK